MEKDFEWQAGQALAKMRLLAEGAIVLFESDAAANLDNIGAALYELRNLIEALQTSQNF